MNYRRAIFGLFAGLIFIPELSLGSCLVTTLTHPTRKQRKVAREIERQRVRRRFLVANARLLQISLAANKTQYLAHETPVFTVTITNPYDRALEVPLPFHPRTSEFGVVGYREDCGFEPWEIPPTTVMLPLETVSTQVSGYPQYPGHASKVQYFYGYMGYGATAEIQVLAATIQTRTEIPLANTLHWTDSLGNKTESPRTATVVTVEGGGKHYLALHLFSHQSDFNPGRSLFYNEFERLKFIDESDQPIQIRAVTESPVNSLNIDYAVGTASTKRLQFILSDTTNRILGQ